MLKNNQLNLVGTVNEARGALETYAQIGYMGLSNTDLEKKSHLLSNLKTIRNSFAGSEQYPFELYYVEDLYIMSGMMRQLDPAKAPFYFKLMRDLDFRCPESYYDYKNSRHFYWEKRDWSFCTESNKEVIESPISLDATAKCYLDGDNHVLSGFTTIPNDIQKCSGIFGTCKNVCIENLTLYDIMIYGNSSMFASSITEVDIFNCQLCHCSFLPTERKRGEPIGIIAGVSSGYCELSGVVAADIEIPKYYRLNYVAHAQDGLHIKDCFQFEKEQIKRWYIKK